MIRGQRIVGDGALSLLIAVAMVGAGWTAPTAAAGGYCTGDGVNVVVDYGALGGGVARACDPAGAGKSAWQVFEAAGFGLTEVQRQPGAVCRVEGRPADVSCVDMPPANRYWGLFSSGGSGWSYASVGAKGMAMRSGQTVAFAWQQGSGRRAPATAPAAPAPTAKPTSSATTTKPTGKASAKPTKAAKPHRTAGTTSSRDARATAEPTPDASPTVTPTASATAATPTAGSGPDSGRKPGRQPGRQHSVEPGSPPTLEPSAQAQAETGATSAAAPESEDSGLPAWIPALVVVLLGAGGGVAVWRRRGAGR